MCLFLKILFQNIQVEIVPIIDPEQADDVALELQDTGLVCLSFFTK